MTNAMIGERVTGDQVRSGVHELKVDQRWFERVWKGEYQHEIRKADREFQVGQTLWLREYVRKTDCYTGREITAKITGVEADVPEMNLMAGYVVVGFDMSAARKIINPVETPDRSEQTNTQDKP